MNDKKELSVFEQYALIPSHQPTADEDETDIISEEQHTKHPYRAFCQDEADNPAIRLNIEHGGSDRYCHSMAKNNLIGIEYSNGTYLSLIFTTGVFLMEGKNLDPLYIKLNREKVASLCCFNPALHEQPNESDTILTRIEPLSLQEAEALGSS
ncbi:MAG: hypothetical protein AAF702_38075 [Chloroflexota bacterium]